MADLALWVRSVALAGSLFGWLSNGIVLLVGVVQWFSMFVLVSVVLLAPVVFVALMLLVGCWLCSFRWSRSPPPLLCPGKGVHTQVPLSRGVGGGGHSVNLVPTAWPMLGGLRWRQGSFRASFYSPDRRHHYRRRHRQHRRPHPRAHAALRRLSRGPSKALIGLSRAV